LQREANLTPSILSPPTQVQCTPWGPVGAGWLKRPQGMNERVCSPPHQVSPHVQVTPPLKSLSQSSWESSEHSSQSCPRGRHVGRPHSTLHCSEGCVISHPLAGRREGRFMPCSLFASQFELRTLTLCQGQVSFLFQAPWGPGLCLSLNEAHIALTSQRDQQEADTRQGHIQGSRKVSPRVRLPFPVPPTLSKSPK
jgi:hypothetical protein